MRRRAGLRGGTVPWGRVAIATQVLLALFVVGFLVTRFDVSLPFVHPTYEMEAVLPDAAGLAPADRPLVVAGGVRLGRVVDVRYSQPTGRAVATLQLDDASQGKLFRDATLRIVPRSALQDLVVDIDPGTPSAGTLKPGAQIVAGPRSAPVGYDRVLGVLDTDTQAYTQILISTLRELLRDRPGPLRDALDRMPALNAPATRLAEELAGRRRDLTALIDEFDTIASATGRRGRQLGHAVTVARATLDVTAARQREIEQAFTELPSTLDRASSSMRSVRALATPLDPALTGLRPAARALPGALRATRRLLPASRALLADAKPVVTTDRPALRQLAGALTELAPAARGIRPSLPALHHLVSTMSESRNYMLDLLGNWPGAISIAGHTGVETRTLLLGLEKYVPALFGVDTPGQADQLAAALERLKARRPELFGGAGDGSALATAARAMLIKTCPDNDFACVLAQEIDRQGRTR